MQLWVFPEAVWQLGRVVQIMGGPPGWFGRHLDDVDDDNDDDDDDANHDDYLWLQVFQRRRDGLTEFYRPWEDYVTGFGDPGSDGEFWLGKVTGSL